MNQEEKIPTKEEIILFLQEQIEVKRLQAELSDLNMKIAIGRAEELKALSFISNMTNPQVGDDKPYDGGEPHTVTQKDLDNNPEMVEAGLNVGDEIMIPKRKTLKKK